MIDWGLDFSTCFRPARVSHLGFWDLCRRSKMEDRSRMLAIHEMALAKNAYFDYSDIWLQNCPPFKEMHSSPWFFTNWNYWTINAFALKLTLPYVFPGHYQLPPEKRLFRFCGSPGWADNLRYILWEDGRVRADDIKALGHHGLTLLQMIAYRYKVGKCAAEWRQLAKEIIPSTTLLHSTIQRPTDIPPSLTWPGGTTFSTLINETVVFGFDAMHRVSLGITQRRRKTEVALTHWLQDLEICGIDLNEYGRIEKSIFLETKPGYTYYYLPTTRPNDPYVKLADFEYGPKPADWKLHWEIEYGEMVRDFWHLIENPALNMVGAWVDDDDFGWWF